MHKRSLSHEMEVAREILEEHGFTVNSFSDKEIVMQKENIQVNVYDLKK